MKKDNQYSSEMAREIAHYSKESDKLKKSSKNFRIAAVSGAIIGAALAGLFVFGGEYVAKTFIDNFMNFTQLNKIETIGISTISGVLATSIIFMFKYAFNMNRLNNSEPRLNKHIENLKENFPEFKDIPVTLLREGLIEASSLMQDKKVSFDENTQNGKFYFNKNDGNVTLIPLVIPSGKDLETNLIMGEAINKANKQYYDYYSQYSFTFTHGTGFIDNEPANIFVADKNNLDDFSIEVHDEVINRNYSVSSEPKKKIRRKQ